MTDDRSERAFELRQIAANGITINVATAGSGPPVLLLHGWPHTWEIWRKVMVRLAGEYRLIAPDLRGVGGTTRAAEGYDLHTLAGDASALLEALGVGTAVAVGIDAGAPVAWMLAMRHPDRVRRLVVMESLLGTLPGAEGFLKGGPPWWFGFHAVPGLGETVIEGHEEPYLDWFLRSGTFGGRGVDPATRAAILAAYCGREALRCGFEYYRALPGNAAQVAEMAASRRVTVPAMALGGNVVGDALHRQLQPITDDLTGHVLDECGHIIPEDQPERLAMLLRQFIERTDG